MSHDRPLSAREVIAELIAHGPLIGVAVTYILLALKGLPT